MHQAQPLIVSEKQINQNGAGVVRNSYVSSGSALDTVIARHEVCGNLCQLALWSPIWVLLIRFKDVLKRPAIPGSAPGSIIGDVLE
jgi:hypothetical protein